MTDRPLYRPLAVDAQGVLGVIQTSELVTDEWTMHTYTKVRGRELFSGRPWSAVDPVRLCEGDCMQLRKAALWWHDQEAE